MANLRELRRHVKYVCGDLAAECMFLSAGDERLNDEALEKIITKIAVLQATALERLNIKFDKTPKQFANDGEYRKAKRAYFREAYQALLKDFAQGVQAIVDELNATLNGKA